MAQELSALIAAFIVEDASKGHAREVIDGQVHSVPANAAVAVLGPIAGDAMAHAPDAAQPLGVDVQQLAWAGAFIAAHRRRRLQRGESTQADAFHIPRHGGQAAAGFTRDAPQRQTLAALLGEVLNLLGRTGLRAAVRARTAVKQAVQTFASEAGKPLVTGAQAHPCRLAGLPHRPVLLHHPVNKKGST
ncbi:Uncharacterised protein [Bordetella pertussis]|nr:Uncharacterised protein [Bordetella pertussis]